MRVASFGFLLFASAFASEAANAQSTAIPQFNCTPICGTKTCCIAQHVTIPVCTVQGAGNIDTMNSMFRQGGIGEIIRQCPSPIGISRSMISSNDQDIGVIERLKCHWGCCAGARIIESIRDNPEIANWIFKGTDVEGAGKDFQSTHSDASLGRLTSALDRSGSDKLCIFCCTW
jgi:hypothetical protein